MARRSASRASAERMVHALGVHLLPASGEFVYDTLPYSGAQRVAAGLGPYSNMNTFARRLSDDRLFAVDRPVAGRAPRMRDRLAGLRVVLRLRGRLVLQHLSVDQLSARRPFRSTRRARWSPTTGVVSSLTQADYPGIIPLPALPGDDQFRLWRHAERSDRSSAASTISNRAASASSSIRSCSGPGSGFPWRGRITFSPDVSSAATRGGQRLPRLGAAPSDFTPRHGQSDGRLFGLARSIGPIGG